MKTFPFQKSQRLTLKKEIEALFRQGKSFHYGSLRVVYQVIPDGPEGLRVLITIPRRKFRNATDRNKIRRLIREAYRLNRSRFITDEMASVIGINLGLVYTGESAEIDFGTVTEMVSVCLKKLAFEINTGY